MARRRRRCASVVKLVDRGEKEEGLEVKAKKLGSKPTEKEQQQQTRTHTGPKETVVTRAARAATRNSAILTRAARRRAGIPPPTPLFRGGAKHLKTKVSRQEKSSSTSSSSSSSSDEDDSGKPLWVQCDHRSCQKWRKLPPGTKIDIEENWYCCMHPDPTYQSCDMPEEKCPVSRKRAFTFSKLSAGQLVWARLKGFPPWPAVVSPDPWSDGDYINEYREGCIYHVEFLGKMRTHSWVPEEQIEPYHCQTLCSLGEIRKSKRLEHALSEADSFATLSDQERLTKCEYTDNTVKVEDSEPQTRAQNIASNLSQKAHVGGNIAFTTSNRRGRPPNSNKTTTQVQVASQPLRDMTNNTAANQSITANLSSQGSTTGAYGDLFKTLGMGFNEGNHMNLVTNTLIQQIQAQVIATLNQHGIATTSNTEPVRASVQRSSLTMGAKKSNSSMAVGVQQPPKLAPSSTNHPQGGSPMSRLTQTSLELSPDNQVKLVTTKQAGLSQRKVNRRRASGKENSKRKRQSPLLQAGGGKRSKGKKGGSAELVSPSIRDYFKSSGSARNDIHAVKEPERGATQDITKDQEVPIAGATGVAGGRSTFQSLEMEAESELLEIQTMLSMFDDTPAAASSAKDKPQDTYTETTSSVQSQPSHRLNREQSSKQMLVTDKVSSSEQVCYSVTKPGDDMDIESILQEMNTIDDLLQDLSQAQVVPYSQ